MLAIPTPRAIVRCLQWTQATSTILPILPRLTGLLLICSPVSLSVQGLGVGGQDSVTGVGAGAAGNPAIPSIVHAPTPRVGPSWPPRWVQQVLTNASPDRSTRLVAVGFQDGDHGSAPPRPDLFPPPDWREWKASPLDYYLDPVKLRGFKVEPIPPSSATDLDPRESVLAIKRACKLLRVTEPAMVDSFEWGWANSKFGLGSLEGAGGVRVSDHSVTVTSGASDQDGGATIAVRVAPFELSRIPPTFHSVPIVAVWTTDEHWDWMLATSLFHEWQHFRLRGQLGLEKLNEWRRHFGEVLPGDRIPREHVDTELACLRMLEGRARYALEHKEPNLLPKALWTKSLERYRQLCRVTGVEPERFEDNPEWAK